MGKIVGLTKEVIEAREAEAKKAEEAAKKAEPKKAGEASKK